MRIAVALVAAGCAVLYAHLHGTSKDCNCFEQQKVQPTADGQIAAGTAVLQWRDIGSREGWTGGMVPTLVPEATSCPGYRPKQADLVRIGSASTQYKHAEANITIDSDVAVMQTSEMVRLDMQRTALSPQLLPCLRKVMPTVLDDGMELVSVERMQFPRVGTYTAAWRMIAGDRSSAVRVISDQIVIGQGKTEIILTVSGEMRAAGLVHPLELKMARSLAARVDA